MNDIKSTAKQLFEGEALIKKIIHDAKLTCCIFSLDGKLIASAGSDKTVRLWDVAMGEEKAIFTGHSDSVLSCAFSPDGKSLASASGDKTLRLWDLSTGTERAVLEGHNGRVLSCAFSPDGKTLALASGDKTVRLWDVITGKQIYVYPCIGRLNRCSFSPFGKTLAASDEGGNVYILDLNGFEFRSFGIDSEVDSLTEQDPERFSSKNKNQKEKKMQQGFAGSTCRCGKINPPHSKWCQKCGREIQ